MKEIGGFFELELNRGKEYHFNAIKLNLGRTAFEYILRAKKIRKIYIPWYTCDVILEPLKKLGVEYTFYQIDKNLEPILNIGELNKSDYLLFNNYFGVKDSFISEFSQSVKNLIIDNSQAFFSMPLKGIDTFYSPRKFFGLPDGGYLYTDALLPINFNIDNSFLRFDHLIGRIENGAESSYEHFITNDSMLQGKDIMKMSEITHRLLQNIDYKEVSKTRIKNFFYLHKHLGNNNIFTLDIDSINVPMVYPYWTKKIILREWLFKNKIFVAKYWPNVLKWTNEEMLEHKLVNELFALPVDQRYGIPEMDRVIEIVLKYG